MNTLATMFRMATTFTLFVSAAQGSNPNHYLVDVETVEDPELRIQYSFQAEQMMHCSLFAMMAEMEEISGILIKNMRIYQRMAGLSDEEAAQQAFNANRYGGSMVRGYLQGYKARLLETGGDLSEIDEQFHIDTGKTLYQDNDCDRWASLLLEDSEN